MYISLWKPPEGSKRMWSVNLDASSSGEYQTVGGHSSQPSEYLRSPMTGTGVPWEWLWLVWEHLGAPERTLGAPGRVGYKSGSAVDKSGSTSNHSRAVREKHLLWECCRCAWNAAGAPGMLQAVVKSNLRCTWKWPSHELRYIIRRRDGARLEIHLEAVIQ
jgi:hypothetical protein